MKFLIAIGLLIACNLASCYYTDSDTSASRYMQYLKQRNQVEMLRRQISSICPGKEDELDDALLQLKECSDEIDENTETACSAIKNHFLRCSKPFIELLESCAPEQSKEVPRLIFTAINSGASYLCKTDGEHIFELANQCIFKADPRSGRCERRVRAKMQQYKNRSPSKSDICEVAQSLKPCLYSHLQNNCGNAITRESFMGMFDALTAPCNLSSPNLNAIETNSLNEVEVLA